MSDTRPIRAMKAILEARQDAGAQELFAKATRASRLLRQC